MNEIKFNGQSGKSLTETLVVLVIAAIIITFAVAQFAQSKDKFQRQNVARELKNSLERARFDSIKRHASDASTMAYVKVSSATSFSVSTDSNQNGVLDSFESRLTSFTNNNIKIIGNNLVYPITIRFDRRGFMTATNGIGTEITPSFTICDNCTLATANVTNSSTISVSQTGTVLMATGSQTQPTLSTPNVSMISGSSQIKSTVVVSPTPTPSTTQPCTVILVLCI